MTEFIGHENIKRQLSSAATGGHIGHAYIFEGIDGIGKTTAAFWFAHISMCSISPGSPCEMCDTCTKSNAGTHPDIIYVDENFINNPKIKPGSIDAMRMVKKDVYTKPFMASRKFYIIPDGDKMLTAAQNSLLKVFEEPPEYCSIIILCENSSSLVQTIRSRAVTVRFNPLSDADMIKYIGSKHSSGDYKKILKLCRGVPAIADAVLSEPDYLTEIDMLSDVFSAYLRSDGDMTDILPLITKDNTDFAIACLEGYISQIIETGKGDTLACIDIFDILQNSRRRLKMNCNFNLTVTDMLIKSWEAIHG